MIDKGATVEAGSIRLTPGGELWTVSCLVVLAPNTQSDTSGLILRNSVAPHASKKKLLLTLTSSVDSDDDGKKEEEKRKKKEKKKTRLSQETDVSAEVPAPAFVSPGADLAHPN